MSVARNIVCDRLAKIERAVSDFGLNDLPATPANIERNDSARIIRCGLAVQTFNVFEDFLRQRMAELLSQLSASGVRFQHLPDELQKATTIDVYSAVQFQFKILDKSARISYAQDHASKVHSTAISIFNLSELSFFYSGSNIGKDQFRDAMIATSINKPWDQIGGLCSRIGMMGMPPDQIFESFAGRRHHAAHDPQASVSEVDLLQSVKDAKSLACCFDVLVSCAIKAISAQTLKPTAKILSSHSLIPLRFIRYANNRFFEAKEGSSKAYRTASLVEALMPAAMVRSAKEKGALVVFDKVGNLKKWDVN